MDEATFVAAFPALDYAIRISGTGEGMRILLDVPESELAEGLKLLAWREMPLQITVRPLTRAVTMNRIR